MDEVSGLTVNSPDETLEEGPHLLLQSPGGHQEDRSCAGTGQRVGHEMQMRNFDMHANVHKGALAAEKENNSVAVRSIAHTHTLSDVFFVVVAHKQRPAALIAAFARVTCGSLLVFEVVD